MSCESLTRTLVISAFSTFGLLTEELFRYSFNDCAAKPTSEYNGKGYHSEEIKHIVPVPSCFTFNTKESKFVYSISGLLSIRTFSLFFPCQMTPLHMAAAESHVEIMEFLIDKGADVNTQDKDWVNIYTIVTGN